MNDPPQHQQQRDALQETAAQATIVYLHGLLKSTSHGRHGVSETFVY